MQQVVKLLHHLLGFVSILLITLFVKINKLKLEANESTRFYISCTHSVVYYGIGMEGTNLRNCTFKTSCVIREHFSNTAWHFCFGNWTMDHTLIYTLQVYSWTRWSCFERKYKDRQLVALPSIPIFKWWKKVTSTYPFYRELYA